MKAVTECYALTINDEVWVTLDKTPNAYICSAVLSKQEVFALSYGALIKL